jgi:hypothetical protein
VPASDVIHAMFLIITLDSMYKFISKVL